MWLTNEGPQEDIGEPVLDRKQLVPCELTEGNDQAPEESEGNDIIMMMTSPIFI